MNPYEPPRIPVARRTRWLTPERMGLWLFAFLGLIIFAFAVVLRASSGRESLAETLWSQWR